MFDDLKNESSANDSEGFFDSISRTIEETLLTVGARVTCLSFMFSERRQEKSNPIPTAVNEEEREGLIKSERHLRA